MNQHQEVKVNIEKWIKNLDLHNLPSQQSTYIKNVIFKAQQQYPDNFQELQLEIDDQLDQKSIKYILEPPSNINPQQNFQQQQQQQQQQQRQQMGQIKISPQQQQEIARLRSFYIQKPFTFEEKAYMDQKFQGFVQQLSQQGQSVPFQKQVKDFVTSSFTQSQQLYFHRYSCRQDIESNLSISHNKNVEILSFLEKTGSKMPLQDYKVMINSFMKKIREQEIKDPKEQNKFYHESIRQNSPQLLRHICLFQYQYFQAYLILTAMIKAWESDVYQQYYNQKRLEQSYILRYPKVYLDFIKFVIYSNTLKRGTKEKIMQVVNNSVTKQNRQQMAEDVKKMQYYLMKLEEENEKILSALKQNQQEYASQQQQGEGSQNSNPNIDYKQIRNAIMEKIFFGFNELYEKQQKFPEIQSKMDTIYKDEALIQGKYKAQFDQLQQQKQQRQQQQQHQQQQPDMQKQQQQWNQQQQQQQQQFYPNQQQQQYQQNNNMNQNQNQYNNTNYGNNSQVDAQQNQQEQQQQFQLKKEELVKQEQKIEEIEKKEEEQEQEVEGEDEMERLKREIQKDLQKQQILKMDQPGQNQEQQQKSKLEDVVGKKEEIVEQQSQYQVKEEVLLLDQSKKQSQQQSQQQKKRGQQRGQGSSSKQQQIFQVLDKDRLRQVLQQRHFQINQSSQGHKYSDTELGYIQDDMYQEISFQFHNFMKNLVQKMVQKSMFVSKKVDERYVFQNQQSSNQQQRIFQPFYQQLGPKYNFVEKSELELQNQKRKNQQLQQQQDQSDDSEDIKIREVIQNDSAVLFKFLQGLDKKVNSMYANDLLLGKRTFSQYAQIREDMQNQEEGQNAEVLEDEEQMQEEEDSIINEQDLASSSSSEEESDDDDGDLQSQSKSKLKLSDEEDMGEDDDFFKDDDEDEEEVEKKYKKKQKQQKRREKRQRREQRAILRQKREEQIKKKEQKMLQKERKLNQQIKQSNLEQKQYRVEQMEEAGLQMMELFMDQNNNNFDGEVVKEELEEREIQRNQGVDGQVVYLDEQAVLEFLERNRCTNSVYNRLYQKYTLLQQQQEEQE